MSISLIVAVSNNNAIGKNNQLLWHLPNDLKFFKNTTWGKPVIMGRKTFESVNKPLLGRTNIIISNQINWKRDGVLTSLNLTEAIQQATQTNCKDIFIIGGGEIYKQSIAFADTVYLTRVHTDIEDADTFFEPLENNIWHLAQNVYFKKDDNHLYNYSFQTWKRNEINTTPIIL